MGNQQKHRIVHVLHIPTRRDFPSFQPWSTPLASRPNQTANVERSRGDVNDVTRGRAALVPAAPGVLLEHGPLLFLHAKTPRVTRTNDAVRGTRTPAG